MPTPSPDASRCCNKARPYVDGGPHYHSLALLCSFATLYEKEQITIIYGALEDKDHEHMVRTVLDHTNRVIVSRPGTYKKSDLGRLKALFDSMAEPDQTILLIEENSAALDAALSMTREDGAILVCGRPFLPGGEASRRGRDEVSSTGVKSPRSQRAAA